MLNQSNLPMPSGNGPNADSPIPAWKHYDILKDAEARIMRELQNRKAGSDSEHLLAGLTVGYTHIPENGTDGKIYSISFGYAVDADEEGPDDEIEVDPRQNSSPLDALDENFVDRLYKDVRETIEASAPPNSGAYLVNLEITTAQCPNFTLICWGRKCAICRKHNVTHILRLRTSLDGLRCVWRCTGTAC